MSKSKVKVAQQSIKDPELIEMFNQMLGTSATPDLDIVVPKYERIYANINDCLNILASFANSPCAKIFRMEFNTGFMELDTFIKTGKDLMAKLKLEKQEGVLSGDDLQKLNSDPSKLEEYVRFLKYPYKVHNLAEMYKELKENQVSKELIMAARRFKNLLTDEKNRSKLDTHDLEKKESLRNGFITNADGDFLKIFEFTSLDFKQLYYSTTMNADFNKYILLVLHLVYVKVIGLVEDITAPDINVEKFSEILVANIDNIKKYVPRCDKAFDKIKDSVGLLKQNFGEYYKDCIVSQNPGVIIENFVIDVSKSSNADPEITRQFRDIVKFYRKNVQSSVKDPKTKKLFSMLGQHMDILDNAVNPDSKKEKEEEEEEDE
jgi:hypothetical protein